ncbi:MAG: Lrp/AsnC family transcriptional regulator [Paracoccaceae bacterium]|nr:Lrp/AsnC family transcriptional regulator [Paracoccaceae bacterium]
MQIDEKDRQLLALLGENARMPISELARRLGLARTTVQARMERLERSGAIAGYTIRRGTALQPPLRATVLIAVEPRAGPAVVDRLRVLTGVEKVYTTSGRFDLLAQVVAASTAELDATLDRIAEVSGLRSSESLIHLATKIDRG